MSASPFADRLAALTAERRSQVCLGLDPAPGAGWGLDPGARTTGGNENGGAAGTAARAVADRCTELIELAGPACVAVKPQLASFERFGADGRAVLDEVLEAARQAGLLVVADGKRSDVPVSAEAYAQSLAGRTETPFGDVEGMGADAFTVNPLLGLDSLEPFVEAAAMGGAGIFTLVRTSNPGAADLQDLDAGGRPLHEHIAELVATIAPRLAGPESGLSGSGAVIGATRPEHLGRLRELMPDSIFLIPGVGAQGGRAEDLGAAIVAEKPASVLVPASRAIAAAEDPGKAAEDLRATVWSLGS